MNREIKFRAFKDGVMYYGVESAYDTIGSMGDGKGGRLDYYWQSFQDVLKEAKKGELQLMQYTGLKDKNGKECYEGDLLARPGYESNEEHHYEVVFRNGAFRIAQKGEMPLTEFNMRSFIIIGNVYEGQGR